MPSAEAARLDDMMRKIEGLLATADSLESSNPEAAANYRANAERMMRKYKIDQEDLIARGDLKVDGLNILFKEVKVYHLGSHYSTVYAALMSYAAAHTGCYRVWTGYVDGERVITLAGYESDIRYTEALYMGARLMFSDRMEPKVDPNLSDMENVYRMRNAGLERRVVADRMGWVKGGAKVTRLYKAACEARGEDPVLTGQGINVADFRLAYADGFKSEFWQRLWNARMAVDKEITDGGMVLHGREERIKEAVYQRWPQLRPSTEPAVPEKNVKPFKFKPPTKAEQRAMDRMNSATARAGRQAGRKAASEVDVSNGTPRKRLDERY